MMPTDYIVFWNDGRSNVVRVEAPPHNPPRGSDLQELLSDALPSVGDDVTIHGAVELPSTAWSEGRSLELVTPQAQGRVASVECTNGSWRVHA